MRWPLLSTVWLVAAFTGCGAGPSTASGVKSPRASKAPAPNLAQRSASPVPTRQALPRTQAKIGKPSTKSSPPADISKLQQLWATRRVLSCQVKMSIEQGEAQGELSGSIAWVSPSPQEPSGLIMAQLSGAVGGESCRLGLRSAKDALLVESWQPTVKLSGMQQLPSAMTPTHIEGLRQLETPMVQTLLATGCPTRISVPAGQKAMWTLLEASKRTLRWQGLSQASQVLTLDESGTLPKKRVLEFFDARGLKVRWSIELNCKSAG